MRQPGKVFLGVFIGCVLCISAYGVSSAALWVRDVRIENATLQAEHELDAAAITQLQGKVGQLIPSNNNLVAHTKQQDSQLEMVADEIVKIETFLNGEDGQ